MGVYGARVLHQTSTIVSPYVSVYVCMCVCMYRVTVCMCVCAYVYVGVGVCIYIYNMYVCIHELNSVDVCMSLRDMCA